MQRSVNTRLLTNVFLGKSEVRRTGSDGHALTLYYAIMASSSKFTNISLTFFTPVMHHNHFTLH